MLEIKYLLHFYFIHRYYDSNWHNISDQWTAYGRSESLNFGVRTTNHAESHNAVIGRLLKRSADLPQLLNGLLVICSVSSVETDHRSHDSTAKVPLYHGQDKSFVREFLQAYCTPFVIEILIKQENFSKNVVSERIAKYEATEEDCKCTFRGNNNLPCRHMMFLRHAKKRPILSMEDMAPRWFLDYEKKHDLPTLAPTVLPSTLQIRKNPKARSAEEKYNVLMQTMKKIASLASGLGEKKFTDVHEKAAMFLDCLKNNKSIRLVVENGKQNFLTVFFRVLT